MRQVTRRAFRLPSLAWSIVVVCVVVAGPASAEPGQGAADAGLQEVAPPAAEVTPAPEEPREAATEPEAEPKAEDAPRADTQPRPETPLADRPTRVRLLDPETGPSSYGPVARGFLLGVLGVLGTVSGVPGVVFIVGGCLTIEAGYRASLEGRRPWQLYGPGLDIFFGAIGIALGVVLAGLSAAFWYGLVRVAAPVGPVDLTSRPARRPLPPPPARTEPPANVGPPGCPAEAQPQWGRATARQKHELLQRCRIAREEKARLDEGATPPAQTADSP